MTAHVYKSLSIARLFRQICQFCNTIGQPLPFLLGNLLQRAGELVGARCRLGSATYAAQTFHDLRRCLSLDKGGNALGVAMAAACKGYGCYHAVVYFDVNGTRACA